MMEISKTGIVKKFILQEIKEGRIIIGQRLPSCRKVALHLSINKITVNKAYGELEEEHRVYSIPRGGFYLMDSQESPKVVQETVDFKSVKPDERLIPFREFTHVMNQAVDLYKNSLFIYEPTGGLSSLRDTLQCEFEKDGVYTATDRIIITNGAQQAIELALRATFRNSKSKLLVEAPTYGLVLKLADYLGIEIIGIERRMEGFDYKEMEMIFNTGEISAFYIIPRHHNPTGYTLTEKDKRKIAELAMKYNVLIIEDDYLADLGSRKGYMPIHYYDISKRTVYIRSFSKTFMPGIRMGAAVLPEVMMMEMLNLKHLSDLNTSKIPQAALDIFIRSGMYEKHIKKVRKSYETKLKKAAEIFKACNLGGINLHVPEHGIFIWLQLPEHVADTEVENELKNHGILVKAASEFYPESWVKENKDKNCNSLRLCISGVLEERLDVLGTVVSVITRH